MLMRRMIAGMFIASAGIGLGYPAAAAADPECRNTTVTIQGEVVPAPQPTPCNDPILDDGLLGNAPVVGNLPGVSGVL